MRPLIALTLFAAAVPALAQTTPTTTGAPAAPPATTSASPAAVAVSPKTLLDSLIGKKQILGVTKQDGTRYLCRIVSGDHGVYVAQEFHFAGPPKTAKETGTPTMGAPKVHTKYITIGSGRNRRRMPITTYTPGTMQKARTAEVKTGTIIPDDQAVRLLLAGVAGSIKSPAEMEGVVDMLSTAQVKYLQLLTPPTPPATTQPLPKPAGDTTVTAPAAPASKTAWTMTTLWPTTEDATNKGGRRKGHRKPK